jgi:hypothetical protein
MLFAIILSAKAKNNLALCKQNYFGRATEGKQIVVFRACTINYMMGVGVVQ